MTIRTSQNNDNNRDESIEKAQLVALKTIWLGMRDSNPRSWNQNPLPYHLANPHCCLAQPALPGVIIQKNSAER